MLPLKDENPHPPGFKPRLTIALIIVNVIVFFADFGVFIFLKISLIFI